MANKKKICHYCKELMIAVNMRKSPNGSHFCSLDHQVAYAYKNKEKGRKIKHKQQKKDMLNNDKSHRTKCTQKVFNTYIRLRDDKERCISCDRHHRGQYHAGHYKSIGAHPELRFEELNCHKQCSACNNFLSGNTTKYRINLIKKIGLKNVELIECDHLPKKYTCEELIEIENFYKNKIKMLQSQLN